MVENAEYMDKINDEITMITDGICPDCNGSTIKMGPGGQVIACPRCNGTGRINPK